LFFNQKLIRFNLLKIKKDTKTDTKTIVLRHKKT
jgi:hypothetical protein